MQVACRSCHAWKQQPTGSSLCQHAFGATGEEPQHAHHIQSLKCIPIVHLRGQARHVPMTSQCSAQLGTQRQVPPPYICPNIPAQQPTRLVPSASTSPPPPPGLSSSQHVVKSSLPVPINHLSLAKIKVLVSTLTCLRWGRALVARSSQPWAAATFFWRT